MPGSSRRRPVEDDPLAHQHEPFDEALDGAELVRDVEDRHAELVVQPMQQLAERVLRLDVDAGRRLVEHEQPRMRRERLRDERALLLAARQRAQPPPREGAQADALERLVDRVVVVPAQPAVRPQRRAPRFDDLAHGRRRVQPDRRPLGEVADARAVAEAPGGLAVEQHLPARRPLEAEREPEQRRLAAAVRPGDRDELPLLDPQVDAGRAPVGPCP